MGGGFLVVPALVLLCGISMKDAVGKALLIVAIDCCAWLLGYFALWRFRSSCNNAGNNGCHRWHTC